MQGKGDGKNNKKPSLNLATAPTREVRRNSLNRRPRRAGSIIEILDRKSSTVRILFVTIIVMRVTLHRKLFCQKFQIYIQLTAYSIEKFMLHQYDHFIKQILALIPKDKLDIPSEQYQISHVWTYTQDIFTQHQDLITTLGEIGYVPDFVYLRESLSGDYPILYLYETKKFEESYWSAKSDLIPSVTFTKMNETKENLPMVRIEFSHEGIVGIDY